MPIQTSLKDDLKPAVNQEALVCGRDQGLARQAG